ncbi:MAG TPA: WXG100 family type VII secretion target [Candidatus Ruania gallistercoris]|uniref:ESAT-6-like protein n=1 Tax=Candidatus Ruania gallistercoris TaxID=2838746 RepID=A0A9D2J527_9MICO|nr:WXG100 family type VII secretion target [Candidatus Ruania gallistercoris]
MPRFEVDSAEVARAGASARASATIINTEVTNMMRHLTALQSSWRGGASAAFGALITDWRATQRQVEASLDNISHALDASARQYADVETSNLRMFSR